MEDFASSYRVSCVSWVQLEGVEGKIKFMIELNEQASIILLPIYKRCKEELVENIIGVHLLFYWPIKLKPNRDTEKMVFFKVLDIKKKKN